MGEERLRFRLDAERPCSGGVLSTEQQNALGQHQRKEVASREEPGAGWWLLEAQYLGVSWAVAGILNLDLYEMHCPLPFRSLPELCESSAVV